MFPTSTVLLILEFLPNNTQIFSHLFIECTLHVHYKYRFVDLNNQCLSQNQYENMNMSYENNTEILTVKSCGTYNYESGLES